MGRGFGKVVYRCHRRTIWVRLAIGKRAILESPLRLVNRAFVIDKPIDFGGRLFLREDNILPYEGETRSVWFLYTKFSNNETRR